MNDSEKHFQDIKEALKSAFKTIPKEHRVAVSVKLYRHMSMWLGDHMNNIKIKENDFNE